MAVKRPFHPRNTAGQDISSVRDVPLNDIAVLLTELSQVAEVEIGLNRIDGNSSPFSHIERLLYSKKRASAILTLGSSSDSNRRTLLSRDARSSGFETKAVSSFRAYSRFPPQSVVATAHPQAIASAGGSAKLSAALLQT